jgi:hypothetical protein
MDFGSNCQRDVVRVGFSARGFEVKRTKMAQQYKPETKSFHLHKLGVPPIRIILVLAIECGLTHADILEFPTCQYNRGGRAHG